MCLGGFKIQMYGVMYLFLVKCLLTIVGCSNHRISLKHISLYLHVIIGGLLLFNCSLSNERKRRHDSSLCSTTKVAKTDLDCSLIEDLQKKAEEEAAAAARAKEEAKARADGEAKAEVSVFSSFAAGQ